MQINKKIVYLLAGVLALASCWYFLAGRGDVSDIGKRADDTRAGFESAGEEQRDQAAALDRAENAADRVQELERSDAEIIRESQSILEAIRGRGEAEN